MKVLLTHHYFAPVFAGGGEYVTLEVARGLRQRGVDVRVLTTGDPSVTEYEGIPTERIPVHRYAFGLYLNRIVKLATDVDLIQTYNPHACLPSLYAGKWLKKPVVCSVLSLWNKELNRIHPRIGPLWSRWETFTLTRDFTRVLFFSEHSRDLGTLLGVPANRAIVNHPGISLDLYSPAPQKEDVVFTTGRLDSRKGIYSVLEVARRLPHVKFRVIGWGPQEAEIKKLAPANVEFLPFERGAPHRRAFASARIFFFPARAETFGLALVEAMASGCAVISSVPMPFEGIRVGADDLDSMTSAVQRLWIDREESLRMGHRNVELAQQYSWDRSIARLLSIYTQVLSEFSSG
jgi:glycosyltransferase involved in cell wall biosynthesis